MSARDEFEPVAPSLPSSSRILGLILGDGCSEFEFHTRPRLETSVHDVFLTSTAFGIARKRLEEAGVDLNIFLRRESHGVDPAFDESNGSLWETRYAVGQVRDVLHEVIVGQAAINQSDAFCVIASPVICAEEHLHSVTSSDEASDVLHSAGTWVYADAGFGLGEAAPLAGDEPHAFIAHHRTAAKFIQSAIAAL